MDYEQYIETRNQLRGIAAQLELLCKRQSLYLSEDALTLNFILMTIRVMLAAWGERYSNDIVKSYPVVAHQRDETTLNERIETITDAGGGKFSDVWATLAAYANDSAGYSEDEPSDHTELLDAPTDEIPF